MKVRIEAECTPQEAREFLGLPNVTALNTKLVDELDRRVKANSAALEPEELLRNWMTLGGQAQEQFRTLMRTVTTTANAAGAGANKPE